MSNKISSKIGKTVFDPITPLMICNCLRSVDVDTINFITLNRFSNIAKIGN